MTGDTPLSRSRTPDRIAADRLLDRARLLDIAGHPAGAQALRRRAAALTGKQDVTGASGEGAPAL